MVRPARPTRPARPARPFRVVQLAVGLLVLAAVAAAGPSPAASASPPYVAPVAGAVVVDPFRPPPNPYAAGNRGLDLATPPGAPVRAAAAGEVVFAGPVAGALHVTIRHDDGLRSSYSYLAAVLVQTGQHVEQGAPVGVAGATLHVGLRDPAGTYLDPEVLFGRPVRAHLVPGPDEGAEPLAEPFDPLGRAERSALAAVVAAARQATSNASRRAAALAHETWSVSTASLGQLTTEVLRFRDQFDDCTPQDATVPPRPPGRRIAVLVAGLGSTSEHASVDGVDLAALGYGPGDVVRFSYRGGRIPGLRLDGTTDGSLGAVPTSTYTSSDTEVDLHQSADRLLELLTAVARASPGVPIDVIAHSQGGVVVRLALDRAGDADGDAGGGPDPLAALGVVVTLGTPHQGADLATAMAAVGTGSATAQALGAAATVVGADLDLGGTSIEQLSETSSVAAELARPVPDGVSLLSIGASGDLTVPDVRTIVPGAAHSTVHLSGPLAHGQLPAASATTREIGLAVAGAPPTCPDLVAGLADLVTSHVIAQAEDGIGLALATRGP